MDKTKLISPGKVVLTMLLILLLSAPGIAQLAWGRGILPPHNPSADCDRSPAAAASNQWSDLAGINHCRAKLEHLRPIKLPSNWGRLSSPQQLLVIVNMERLSRGLPPIKGLLSSIKSLAAQGVARSTDPPFPADRNSFSAGGGIFSRVKDTGNGPISSDYIWMYDDGKNGLDLNYACTASDSSGCWGHRDIILMPGANLWGGAAAGGGNYTMEFLADYALAGKHITFLWSHEVRYLSKSNAKATAPVKTTTGTTTLSQTLSTTTPSTQTTTTDNNGSLTVSYSTTS